MFSKSAKSRYEASRTYSLLSIQAMNSFASLHAEVQGCDVERDLKELEQHMSASRKPSALICMKLKHLSTGGPGPRLLHFRKMHFSKILQIFGGLVLGSSKTNVCKKICVRQHFSSSTRFASFCTAAISKFSQKISLKNQQFLWKFSKFCKCRKNCKKLPNFKNFSLQIW